MRGRLLTIPLLFLSKERILMANDRKFNSVFDYPVSLLSLSISEVVTVPCILLLRGREFIIDVETIA